jgi:hypothetical protein
VTKQPAVQNATVATATIEVKTLTNRTAAAITYRLHNRSRRRIGLLRGQLGCVVGAPT